MTLTTKFKNFTAALALAVVALAPGFAAPSAWADNSGAVQHPIVLVHGLSGFDTLLIMDYFYGIEGALAGVGATEVYAPSVTAWESNEVRGEE